MKRVLILTDTPLLQTGLGRICREISLKLAVDFEVAIAGWHHMPLPHKFPLFVYALRKGHYEESHDMRAIMQNFIPDVLLCIGDIWDFQHMVPVIQEYKDAQNKDFKALAWITVDGEYLFKSWGEIARSFDGIATFSLFGQKELMKLSPSSQVTVIPPGVDHKVFSAFKENHQWTGVNSIDPNKTFTCLVVGQNSNRKNIPATIEAFAEFSRDKDDVLLFMMTNASEAIGYDLWSIIRNVNLGPKCVIARDAGALGTVDDFHLNIIYNMATVLVNTAIGEGYGLPLLEAQACHCVPMAVNYGSAPDVVEDRGILFKVAAMIYGEFGLRRAIVDHNDIVEQLNVLYKDWKTAGRPKLAALHAKGLEFSGDHTWEKTANRIKDLIQQKITEKVNQSWIKQKVQVEAMNMYQVVPSWGKNCGIAEYSKELAEEIEKNNESVTIFPSNDLTLLVNHVREKKYNVVVFQHEYSFFQDRFQLERGLDDLKKLGVKIIFELHTWSPIKHYNNMLLDKADHLIVHCDHFKANMLNGSEANHVSVIKLSCKPPVSFDLRPVKQNLDLMSGYPIIGSFGFMRDQKGYLEVAQAVKSLIPIFPDIRLLLVCPTHEYGSASYDEKFYKHIEDLGIADRTVIVREYMPEEKLLQVLCCADLFVMNYKASRAGGGNSAAIKTLMRTQRPIIVSDTIYFYDLNEEVYKVPQLDAVLIAEKIQYLIHHPNERKKLVDAANRFLEENSWEKNSQRHLSIYMND